MMATLMPMPTMRTRSAAPCAPNPAAVYVASAQDTSVTTTTTSNRWLGVLGSMVPQTDSFGTKRHDPDVLTGGLT